MTWPPKNNNEFNDDEYVEAAESMQGSPTVTGFVERLWKAGATYQNIRTEFLEMIDDTLKEILSS